jgi:flagellar basal-body rod protein FlgB
VAISDIPILSMLRTKMQWHQERQRVLAENVSNADMPNFRPRDLVAPKFEGRTPPAQGAQASLALATTASGHIAGAGSSGTVSFPVDRKGNYEIRPAGNAVTLEDEMLKVAANQMDYQAATSLYSRSLGLIKTAIGKRG